MRGLAAAAAGIGAGAAVSLAAAVVSNVLTSVLAPAPVAVGASATAPLPSIAITAPSPASGAAAGTTGTGTTGTGTTGGPPGGGSAADSFLVALDSTAPPMGEPLVLFLLPSQGSVSLTGAGCPSTGCLAPSAGLYGYNGGGAISGAGDIYAQLGLTGAGAYGVTVPSLAGASGVSSYLVQAFQVPVNLDPASPIALSEVGAPAGTVVAAYDCVASACANGIAASPLATVGVITSGGGIASAAPATPLGASAPAPQVASAPTPQVASALAPQVAPVDEPAVSAVWGIALLGMVFVRRLLYTAGSDGHRRRCP